MNALEAQHFEDVVLGTKEWQRYVEFPLELPHDEATHLFAFTSNAVSDLFGIADKLGAYDKNYVTECIVDAASLDVHPSQYRFGSNYMASLLDMEDSVGTLFRNAFERRRGSFIVEQSPLTLTINTGSVADFLRVDADLVGGRKNVDMVETGFIARPASYNEIKDPDVIKVDGEQIYGAVCSFAIQAAVGCEPEEVHAIREIVRTSGGYARALRSAEEYKELAKLTPEQRSELKVYVDAVRDEKMKAAERDRADRQKVELQSTLDRLGIDYERDITPIVEGFQRGDFRIISVIDRKMYKPQEEIIAEALAANPGAKVIYGAAISGVGHLLGIGDVMATVYIEK